MGSVNTFTPLAKHKRIVIKIGSSLLVDTDTGALKEAWLSSLADDLAALAGHGAEIVLVSSGAIAMGRVMLGMEARPDRLEDAQAAAAVGQIALGRAYAEALGARDLVAGQVLLTLGDTEARRRYLNARATIQTLLARGAIPVVNENDTVATNEIRYGDNDRLAARVASMIGADALVLLSDIDGLYTAPPNTNPDAQHIPLVEALTPEIEAMAGGEGSNLSRGGMKTKVDAAKMAVGAGAAMVIASGKVMNPLKAIDEGANDASIRCTWFAPDGNPATARKRWIAGSLDPHGDLIIDDGAARALAQGKSLLPAGIRAVSGAFERGDAVRIVTLDGVEVARGLVAYDSEDAQKIAGCKSADIEEILGYAGRNAMVHRDDLALTGRNTAEAVGHASAKTGATADKKENVGA
ncbi:MAG: glutamate 5-kinase [Rhizobiales bacterium]|nr:glutamate 5-kinase [Hyphomicrobiales bacterium]MBO6699666.1 glutamate 5-kinase [Hyphomicrobiales bacterium]MBO6737204.1 glutamate 5-kinase [Hyphomicrobiales bacterium]MBO6911722.1 glutamate 5-kinase [Hyphomicrobiales bacterium]MBO6954856.1 glutamate 5-kinase [Hyphomicrobiales bacterium]